MSLWDALRMNMMISYQELVRTFLSPAALGSEIEGFTGNSRSANLISPAPVDDSGGLQHADQLLKDLVSAVAPTNRYSFLNYLVKQKVLSFSDDGTAHRIA